MKLSQAMALADSVTIDRWTYEGVDGEITTVVVDGVERFRFEGDEEYVSINDQELRPALPDNQAYLAVDTGGRERRMYFWHVYTEAITASTFGE